MAPPLPYRPELFNATNAKAKAALVERVAGLLHALGGHLHGEYPMHAIARGDPCAVEVVDCTLPLSTLPYAAQVLASASDADVTVLGEEDSLMYRCHGGRLLLGKEPQQVTVMLRGHNLLAEPPVFDFHLLSTASSRLYLAKTATPAKVAGDRLARALARVREGVFSLLPRPPWLLAPVGDVDAATHERVVAEYHARAMTSAARLVVERGWRMDDSADGRRSWVVARWERLRSSSVCNHQSSTCPICHETFSASDAVVNLPCNHDFHAVCITEDRTHAKRGIQASGLCAWLASGHVSCPMCRASIAS